MDGAIIDMDGTLLDSMYIWVGMGDRYLEKRKVSAPPDLVENMKYGSLDEMADGLHASGYFTDESKTELVKDMNRFVEDEYFHNAQAKPGTKKFLERLSRAGIPSVLATATDRYLVVGALDRLGLTDYFTDIITCAEAGQGKHSPKIYFDALDILGIEQSGSVVFEDTLLGVETAKNAGFPVAAVYDRWSASNTEKIKSYCDIYLKDIDDFVL
jgi:HAD superfamily hydrolase (TIGR01509 family)